MDVSKEDRKRVSAAINAAEASTSGEIVCVLAQSSTETTALPILLSASVSLASPWLLVAFTAMPLQPILLVQIAIFVVLAIVLCLPNIRVALLPRAAQRSVAHRAAMQNFRAYGIASTKERTGILIFVSLAERYARIIADEGIAARVSQREWQSAVDALIMHMRENRLADGFVAAIHLCGAVLAQHFPRDDTNPNELRDRLHVI